MHDCRCPMKEALLGFTSRTFAKVMKEGSDSLAVFSRGLPRKDFGWVEIRDPMATMEEKQLRELERNPVTRWASVSNTRGTDPTFFHLLTRNCSNGACETPRDFAQRATPGLPSRAMSSRRTHPGRALNGRRSAFSHSGCRICPRRGRLRNHSGL